jgi:hypothetical protein
VRRRFSGEAMHRYPHLLNASTNLLGFSFVIIGALKLTDSNAKSYSDDTSVVLNTAADSAFLGGLLMLTVSLVIGASFL